MGDEADATAAFEVLDDPTRVGILRALAERRAERPRAPRLSFSELRDRVGVEDSGRFNYHLDRLRGLYVADDGAGYALTPAGGTVVSAVLAGGYGADHERGPDPVEGECFVCGGDLRFEYDAGAVRVACEDGHGFTETVPPGAVEDRSTAETVALATRIAHHEMELATDGVCPECYGPADQRVVPAGTVAADGTDLGVSHVFLATCERCGHAVTHFVGGAVVRHPAVVSTYYRAGVDVRERPFWDLDFVARDPAVVGEDPLRVRVEVAAGDRRCSLTLDEAATVVDVEGPR